MRQRVAIRAAVEGDDVAGWFARSWGGTTMAVHERLYDVAELPTMVAVDDVRLLGVLTYVVAESALEIVSCDAEPQGLGTGRALVEAALNYARRCGLQRGHAGLPIRDEIDLAVSC